ncbi:MAG: threonylcarbamoyl-AMP synthase [Candidatus Nanopelagicales bacterium]|nr:threonylcarbamoyl-AMP synthase [Candidatus Nanopelagicales bacterium]
MPQVLKVDESASKADVELAIEAAVTAVKNGGLAVIPTDTSYAVICDAFNVDAIARLRNAKKQTSDIALPIAAGSIETIRGVANFSMVANDLASAHWPGALTLLTIAQDSLAWNIGQDGSALAVRVPHHEVAQAVLSGIGPTVMTGSQIVGNPAVQTVEQAQAALSDLVDVYLDGGSLTPRISTVIDTTTDHVRLIRVGEVTLEQLREIMPSIIDATAS